MISLRQMMVAALLFVGIATASAQTPPPEEKSASLIYAGWFGNTTPTPEYIRAHQAFLETQPFSGMVVYLRDPGLTVNVSMQVMTGNAISYDQIAMVLAPMRGVTFTKIKDNFGLVFGSTPPDFFSDWTTTIQNFANLARAAKDAGLRGIVLDNEQYFSQWGDYPTGVLFPAKTLAEYQVQARLRGKQVMEAMVAQFPAIVVITLHGPYVSELKATWPLFPTWQAANELLGPFFVGFMEGSMGSLAVNVDGGELYDLRSAQQFSDSYDWRKITFATSGINCPFLPVADRSSWPSETSVGFGIYDTAFAGAAMSPAIAKTTVINALKQTDHWVWFYAEGPTFLLPPAQGGASQAWIDALQQAYDEAVTVITVEPPPVIPPGVVPPAVTPPVAIDDAVSTDGTAQGSKCGLLGGEAVVLFLALNFLRGRRQSASRISRTFLASKSTE